MAASFPSYDLATMPAKHGPGSNLQASLPLNLSGQDMPTNGQRDHGPTALDQTLCQYEEFLCGWGAAFINISCTFPVNKLMFRQQLHGHRVVRAATQLKSEGLYNLYRGITPPLLQKTTSMSLMFGMYDKFKTSLRKGLPPHVANNDRIIIPTAAWLAGMCEATLVPCERIQMLLQDKKYQKLFRNTFDAFIKLKSYGYAEYYRGLTPILFRNGASNVIFFSLRDPVKRAFYSNFDEENSEVNHVLADFVSGAILGSVISTIFYPINVVKTRMQTKLGGEMPGFKSTFHVVFLERNESWKKMFRGVHVNFSRSLMSWGIINASYEILKKSFSCPADDLYG